MNIEQTEDNTTRRVQAHAALADPTRLGIVDLLALGDQSSSALGSALGVPSNLLAHHLSVLERAGLVARHRSEGDRRRTYHSLRLDRLGALSVPTGVEPVLCRRVLFVCTANTARSHLAAALWRELSPVAAASAGTEPGPEVDPGTLAAAARHRLTLAEATPRSVEEARREGDLVVTVCDRAHEQLAGRSWAHWSVRDPVAVRTEAAFDAAYGDLRTRVQALAPVVRSL